MRILAILSIIFLGACEVTDGANGAQISYGTSVYTQFNCQKSEFSTVRYTDDHCTAGQSCQWEMELVHEAYWCAGDVSQELDRNDAIEKVKACGFTVETELDFEQVNDPMLTNLNRDFDADFLMMTGDVVLYSHEEGTALNFNSPDGFVFRSQDDVKLSDCEM